MILALLMAVDLVVDVPHCVVVPQEAVVEAGELPRSWGLEKVSGLASWGSTLGLWEQRSKEELRLVLVARGMKKVDDLILRAPRALAFAEPYHLAFWGRHAELVVVGGPPFFVFANYAAVATFPQPAHLVFAGRDQLFWFPLEGNMGFGGFPAQQLVVKSDLTLNNFEPLRETELAGESASSKDFLAQAKGREQFQRRIKVSLTGALRQDGKLWLFQSFGDEGELMDANGKSLRRFRLVLRHRVPRPDLEEARDGWLQKERERIQKQVDLEHRGDATRRPPARLEVEVQGAPARTVEQVLARGSDLLLVLSEEATGVPGVVAWVDEGVQRWGCFTLSGMWGKKPAFLAATHDALWFGEPWGYLPWQTVADLVEGKKRTSKPGVSSAPAEAERRGGPKEPPN